MVPDLSARLILLTSPLPDRLFSCEIFRKMIEGMMTRFGKANTITFLSIAFLFFSVSLSSRFSLSVHKADVESFIFFFYSVAPLLLCWFVFFLLRLSLSTSHFSKVAMPFCRLRESREQHDWRKNEGKSERNELQSVAFSFSFARQRMVFYHIPLSFSFALVSHFSLSLISLIFLSFFVLENRITLSY